MSTYEQERHAKIRAELNHLRRLAEPAPPPLTVDQQLAELNRKRLRLASVRKMIRIDNPDGSVTWVAPTHEGRNPKKATEEGRHETLAAGVPRRPPQYTVAVELPKRRPQ